MDLFTTHDKRFKVAKWTLETDIIHVLHFANWKLADNQLSSYIFQDTPEITESCR